MSCQQEFLYMSNTEHYNCHQFEEHFYENSFPDESEGTQMIYRLRYHTSDHSVTEYYPLSFFQGL